MSAADKAILTCALTGVLTDPRQHPVPVTPAQMAAEARDAFNAGASIMHVHLRAQEPGMGHLPSWDPEVAAEIVDGKIWGRGAMDDKGSLIAILEAGAVCVPNGPCPVPVWPGIMAPSGTLTAHVGTHRLDKLLAGYGIALHADVVVARVVVEPDELPLRREVRRGL